MLKNTFCKNGLNEKMANDSPCKQMSVVDVAKTDMEYFCSDCYEVEE